MADTTYTVTAEEAAILRRLVERERNRLDNPSNRPHVPLPILASPEVLIALAPEGGIPALGDEAVPELGFTGTGSGLGDLFEPSAVECDIYRIVLDDFGVAQLDKVWITALVYNLSGSAIAEGSWVVVLQDRFGCWLAAAVASGGTLRVRAVDGTPSYFPINTLEFEELDGFRVSRPSAGVARIRMTGVAGDDTTELWCNCTVTGGLLTLEDQEHIPSVIRLSAGHYKANFDVTFATVESFQWSFSAIATTMNEIERTTTSVTFQTASGGDPARFGIDVRGHEGDPDVGTGTGSIGTGTGSGSPEFPAGGSASCAGSDADDPLELGVSQGPFSIANGEEQWYQFAVTAGMAYHISLEWVDGTTEAGNHVTAFVYTGLCLFPTAWFGASVNNLSVSACGESASPAVAASSGTVHVKINANTASSPFNSYSFSVDEGTCPP